jgi:hypothetical protein
MAVPNPLLLSLATNDRIHGDAYFLRLDRLTQINYPGNHHCDCNYNVYHANLQNIVELPGCNIDIALV